MIDITDRKDCCGCTACVSVCPAQCIVMTRDEEGFCYPHVTSERCIGCGRCDSVCPMGASSGVSGDPSCFAVRASDSGPSSSGGVFPLLASAILQRGGTVFGAVMDEDLNVCHAETSCQEDISSMCGSKYVQSELYASFEDVRERLDEGRPVLFSGTPCQVAGLRNFLGTDHEMLFTVDFACHGVPSPMLWKRYVHAVSARAGKRLSSVCFRDKYRSWRNYEVRYGYEDGTFVRTPYMKDPYMALFIQNMSLRPSCYGCAFRSGGNVSDITLSDLWNVAVACPQLDDDKGVSGVLANTPKGRALLEGTVSGKSRMYPVEKHLLKERNSGFSDTIPMPEDRESFYAGLPSMDAPLLSYMRRFVRRKPLSERFRAALRPLLSYCRKKRR